MNQQAVKHARLCTCVLILLIAALLLNVQKIQADEKTQQIDHSFFLLCGLDKLAQYYPWLTTYYPSYQNDIRDELIKDPKLQKVLRSLHKKHPGETIELCLTGYLENKIAENIFLAGIAITISFMSGGFVGSISSINFDDVSVFQVYLGNKKKHTSLIHRAGHKDISLPENQSKNKTIRDKLYRRIKLYFAEDALQVLDDTEKELKA